MSVALGNGFTSGGPTNDMQMCNRTSVASSLPNVNNSVTWCTTSDQPGFRTAMEHCCAPDNVMSYNGCNYCVVPSASNYSLTTNGAFGLFACLENSLGVGNLSASDAIYCHAATTTKGNAAPGSELHLTKKLLALVVVVGLAAILQT